MPTSRDPEAPPADRRGLVLSTAAMAILIYTIIEAPNEGWDAPRSIAGFALAAALLIVFITWGRRAADPMLDVDLKGYGPFETGVRLLPVATPTGITSVLGTSLAVRRGTKLVVAAGLVSLAVGLAWTSTASASTSYLTIAAQMVLIGSGIGLTSAPATESIMGAVPAAKAGIGSAVKTPPGSSAARWASR